MSHLATPPSSHPHLHLAGRYAHSFQPPTSLPSTTSTAAYATPGDYFSSGSRKRSRPDSSNAPQTSDWQTPVWAQQCHAPSDEIFGSAFGADATHINDRYTLRDGFDTPGLIAHADLISFDDHDADARRMMRDPEPSARGTDPALSDPLARERNGAARKSNPSSPNGSSEGTNASWPRFALTLPFSLAGKVFTFGTSVLKGFYSGGGKGYDMGERDSPRSHHISPFLNRWQPPSSGRLTLVPGSWYDSPPAVSSLATNNEDGFLGDFEQDNPLSPERPPNKRRQTDKDSWVLVGTPDVDASAPSSPKRKVTSSAVPRASVARTASRRSLLPLSRRQSRTASNGSPERLHPPSPQHPDRRASSAAARPSLPGRAASPPKADSTNVSPEARRFVRRQAKQDRAADKTMNNMSRQLEDLIRQGQAALGTTISVEAEAGGVEDEGFVDDGW